MWVLTHNNFGICSKLQLISNQEGASKVKASFIDIKSEDAEATSFEPLKIESPKYEAFLDDLLSKDQGDQEN
jgi:hypothetical protein